MRRCVCGHRHRDGCGCGCTIYEPDTGRDDTKRLAAYHSQVYWLKKAAERDDAVKRVRARLGVLARREV